MKTLPTKVEYSQKDYQSLKTEFEKLNEKIEGLTTFKEGFINLTNSLKTISKFNVSQDTDFTKELEISLEQGVMAKPIINIRNKK